MGRLGVGTMLPVACPGVGVSEPRLIMVNDDASGCSLDPVRPLFARSPARTVSMSVVPVITSAVPSTPDIRAVRLNFSDRPKSTLRIDCTKVCYQALTEVDGRERNGRE